MDVWIEGPAGRLHGVLWEPEASPRAAAVLCHPHPAHGGNMNSNVVHRAGRALERAGLAVLRFDFRGVRRSEGAHDGDGEEQGDLAAALAWLGERYPGLPLWAGGFSFGARTVVGLLARAPGSVERVLLLALPVLAYPCEEVEDLSLPGLILMGSADSFGTRAALEERFPGLVQRMEVEEIEGADHFFAGALDLLQARVQAWAAANLP
jgi:alpha/beta superfamily hydrolase